MPWVIESSRFLVFCGDSRRIRQIASRAGVEFANGHLDAFLNAASDAAMHLSSFIWAAESVGLGTCPISVVRNHIDEVSAILDLPDHVFPLAGMCVGWPERLEQLSPRLPTSITVHRDRYDDHDVHALIANCDQQRQQTRPRGEVWSAAKAAMVGRSERTHLARLLRSKRVCLDRILRIPVRGGCQCEFCSTECTARSKQTRRSGRLGRREGEGCNLLVAVV